MKPDLIIVGAGLTGLTAAIEAAERGWQVTVAEAHSRPGGRARSLAAPFRANTVDLGLRADAGPSWFRVMDLDDRIYAARYKPCRPDLGPARA